MKLLNALIAGQASEQGQLTVPSWASFARATTRPQEAGDGPGSGLAGRGVSGPAPFGYLLPLGSLPLAVRFFVV